MTTKPRTGRLYTRGQKKVYYLDYQAPGKDGKPYEKKTICLKTSHKRTAEEARAKIMAQIRDVPDRTAYLKALIRLGDSAKAELEGTRATPQSTLMLDDLWQSFIDSKRRPASSDQMLKDYKRTLDGLRMAYKAPNLSIRDITHEMAEQHVTGLEKCLAGQTVNKRIRALRLIWKAVDPDNNPWLRLRSVKTPVKLPFRRLSGEECKLMADNLKGKLWALHLIGYSTGLRKGDILTLKRHEINIEDSLITKVMSKTGKTTRIPMTDELKDMMLFYLLPLTDRQGYLFSRLRENAPETSRQYCRILRQLGIKDTDKGKAGFHSLRKSFVSMMDECGTPIHVTNSLTGHDQGDMHSRYSQADIDIARTWVDEAIHPLLDY